MLIVSEEFFAACCTATCTYTRKSNGMMSDKLSAGKPTELSTIGKVNMDEFGVPEAATLESTAAMLKSTEEKQPRNFPLLFLASVIKHSTNNRNFINF